MDPDDIARQIDRQISQLSRRTTPSIRKIRRSFSRQLAHEPPDTVLTIARRLHYDFGHRWVALELIRYHEPTLRRVDEKLLEEFGAGIDSWGTVDCFAGFLAGPAWLRNQVQDATIHRWAHSADRWWRRAALASTVVLNTPSHGGNGDVARTLGVCRLLVADRDDMVVKALSWALRKLSERYPAAVRQFIDEHRTTLAARVKREVANKLTTGLKNPRRPLSA